MKVLLIVSACVAVCWGAPNDCDGTFGDYLNALKDQVTDESKAKALEEESRDDYYKLTRQCFATGTDDSSKCALTDDELKGDTYGETGPLRGCAECQKLAKGLRDKYMGSKEDVRQCFRKHFGQAVREELEPCIQGKISSGYSFKVPPIPDFDEKTFKYIETVESGIDYRIVARSRLATCQRVNPLKFKNTAPCMDNEFAGIYSKHCNAAKAARAKGVPNRCNARFDEVKKATCVCMDEKRNDWHDRFGKIQEIIKNAQTGSECGQKISDVLGTWLTKIQTAVNDCLPKQAGQQTDLRTLIDLGCGQVIKQRGGDQVQDKLTIGFRFIRLFLDALNDRITIFCDKNCTF